MIAWATGLFFGGLFLVESAWLFMALLLIYIVVVVGAVVGLELRVRRLQEKLTADSGGDFYVDEDDHWIWGMFYYNPNDRRLIVNDRVGMNTSVNLARAVRSGHHGGLPWPCCWPCPWWECGSWAWRRPRWSWS